MAALGLGFGLILGSQSSGGGGGGGGTPQWPDGVIDFALTLDFSKVWNFA